MHSTHIYNLALDVRQGEGDVILSRASFLLNDVDGFLFLCSKYLLKTKGVAIRISVAWVVAEVR